MYVLYVHTRKSQLPSTSIRGQTSDLRRRLAQHNEGKCHSTLKYSPWKINAYFAFEALSKAQSFEKYVKIGSGHAFRYFDKE
ncbi:GIY-YIG nuclease family protein [Cellulosispirillum alkaliphilum]|uniref:GIY-YIG nuclease family protein n=1 Tax=Cellulosispirillum alkaliphilum TaxID=3039283 RepID=UPI003D6FC02C